MSTANESAFEADVTAAEDRAAQLRRELAEIEGGPVESPDMDPEIVDADGDPIVDTAERVDVHIDILGRTVNLERPYAVDVAMFQANTGSKVLMDAEKLAVMADFVRKYMDADQFDEWTNECYSKRKATFFYESVMQLIEALMEISIEDSEQDWKAAQSRVKRRAALKAKQNREKAKSGGK